MFEFGFGQVDVPGSAGAHAEGELFQRGGFWLLEDRPCAFRPVDRLLVFELFVDLL